MVTSTTEKSKLGKEDREHLGEGGSAVSDVTPEMASL